MSPECPECLCDIDLSRFNSGGLPTEEGEIIVCPGCEVALEVKALEGGKTGDGILELAPEEQEDWGE